MDPLAEPFRIPADLVDASDRTGKSISRLLERICGGDGCVHTIRTALVQALERRGIDGEARVPWYFPNPDDYASRLERAGFRIDSIALIPRRTLLPGDIIWWLEIFAQSFVHGFSDSDRQDYLDEVRSVLEPQLRDGNGIWIADYVRLRFSATKAVPSSTALTETDTALRCSTGSNRS
jgi:hypothetical protein